MHQETQWLNLIASRYRKRTVDNTEGSRVLLEVEGNFRLRMLEAVKSLASTRKKLGVEYARSSAHSPVGIVIRLQSLGEVLPLGAVAIHSVNLVVAASITIEDDLLAIG
jgi:hypothetical protein